MIVYIFFRAKGAEIGYNLHSVMQKKTSYQWWDRICKSNHSRIYLNLKINLTEKKLVSRLATTSKVKETIFILHHQVDLWSSKVGVSRLLKVRILLLLKVLQNKKRLFCILIKVEVAFKSWIQLHRIIILLLLLISHSSINL